MLTNPVYTEYVELYIGILVIKLQTTFGLFYVWNWFLI